MSKNPVSRFAYANADLNVKRSRFNRDTDHKTTMSAGLLYPLLCDEVLPGDTYSVDMSSLVRMSTPIHPVMDNAFLDVYWFFVPNRIIWDHWKEFMGESPADPYINPIQYSVPQLVHPTGSEFDGPGVPPKSILDYIGIPSLTAPQNFSALPVRAFCKIWNEWFRDQNLQNAIDLSTGDADLKYAARYFNDTSETYYWDGNSPDEPEAYVLNAAHGGDLPPVNKYHDFFTSALKQPQKGNPVPIPLSGFAPVYATSLINIEDLNAESSIIRDYTKVVDDNGVLLSDIRLVTNQGGQLGAETVPTQAGTVAHINNFGADLSNIAGMYSTINDLRYAFQLQKFLERSALGGSRYRESLKAHFGVTSPDASQQVPEFLSGNRIPINMSQVLQTSATNDVTPQGNTAAYSLTTDKNNAFTKSFTEHGWILCVGCIRTEHTYGQGIEEMWFRKDKFDFYWPEFANISEQPIKNKIIYNGRCGTGLGINGDVDWELAEGTFGYQEAYASYRYKPNRVSAEFAVHYPQSLDIWHYADKYDTQPYLSSEWIRETRSNIDRTLAVSSDLADQFICDFYFKMLCTRAMPLYSTPGLADHH